MTETVRLERMIHAGKTMARLTTGQIALVSGGLPEEKVVVKLREQKGVLQGPVTKIVEASPHRQQAVLHPGLDYSIAGYDYQLELKQYVIKDALGRALRRNVDVPAVRPSPKIWQYRNTIQPVVTRQGLGYRQPESHDVVTLKEDPTANEAIQLAWQKVLDLKPPKGLREIVFRGNDSGDVLVSLIASASARNYLDYAHKLMATGIAGVSYAQFDARGRFRKGSEKLTGQRTLRQTYGQYDISVSASQFAQPNPSASTELYKRLSQLAGQGQIALDLYAGSGIIGMHLAENYDDVTALEIDGSSVARGQADTERLAIKNLNFIKADAKRLELPTKVDLITVDPPRAGLNKDVRALLTSSSAPKLIYVSCDIATWSRDIAEFEKSGWTLESFEPFDFYPHTHHIEILSVLTR